MRVTVGEKSREFANLPFQIPFIEQFIRLQAERSGKLIKGFVANGEEAFVDNIESFLKNQMISIRTIDLVLSTDQQLADELLYDAQQYFQKEIPFVLNMAVNLNKEIGVEEAWEDLSEFFDGCNWFAQCLKIFGTLRLEAQDNVYFAKTGLDRLKKSLLRLSHGAERYDHAWVSEVLRNEVAVLFNDFQQEMQGSRSRHVHNRSAVAH